jgi:hypothetical protein
MKYMSFRRLGVLVAVTALAALSAVAVALADNVVNDVAVDTNTSTKILTITAGDTNGADVGYKIVATGGDLQAGCNATDGSPVTVKPTGMPAGVTTTPTSQSFSTCGTEKGINFKASATVPPGNYPIAVSATDSGTGTYNTTPGGFTLRVVAATPADTTPPVIDYMLNPATPDGDNGWYKSDVSLSWNVTENESPGSLVKTGCVDQNIISDQQETTYSCSATSDGGASATKTVKIKRDATNPTIQGQASPAPNSDGWNNSDVDVSFACDDGTSGIASCGPNKTLTGEGRNQSVTGDAKDQAGNAASDAVSGINIDKHGPTAPAASFDKSKAYTDSIGVDWFKDSVTVSYGGSTDPDLANGDPGSGVKGYSAADSLSSSGTLNYSGKATDHADNDSSATSGTVKVDADNPSLQVTGCPSAPVLLASSQSLAVTASDAESGLKTDPSGSVSLDTSSVGSHTKTVEAEDNVGHKVSNSCTYSVSYKFVGFDSPVDNNGVLNAAKAGQAIPLKWRLLDASSNPVTNLASVKVTATSLACSLGTTTDALEEYAAGSSGLQNLGNGYYQFNWKSPTNYANSCKTLNLDLGEGSPHTALFKFTK